MERQIIISGLTLSLGVLIPFLVLLSILTPPITESPQSWFQRSGSILVVLSIISEIILVSDKSKLTVLSSKWVTTANVLMVLTPSIAIIGTVIWGYGDLYS